MPAVAPAEVLRNWRRVGTGRSVVFIQGLPAGRWEIGCSSRTRPVESHLLVSDCPSEAVDGCALVSPSGGLVKTSASHGVLSHRATSRRAAPQAASAPGGVRPRVDAAFLDLPSPLWHRRRTLSFVNVSTGSVSDLEGERQMPSSNHGRAPHHSAVNRRTFLKRVGGGLGAAALVAGARGGPASPDPLPQIPPGALRPPSRRNVAGLWRGPRRGTHPSSTLG